MFNGVAFPCMTKKGCPQATLKPGTPDFCPCWQDTTISETNIQTGEERFMQGCYFEVSLRVSSHVIKASNRPAAELSAMRGSMAEAVQNAVANFFAKLDDQMVADALVNQRDALAIGDNGTGPK